MAPPVAQPRELLELRASPSTPQVQRASRLPETQGEFVEGPRVGRASSVPLSMQLPWLLSRLWQQPLPAPRLPQLPESSCELSPQHRQELSSNASFFP